jgi:ribosomal protein S7
MLNITPKIKLYKKRFGAQNKELPLSLFGHKKVTFGVKWFFKILKEKKRGVKPSIITDLIFESLNNKGGVIELKKRTYATALRNKFLLSLIKR